MVESPFATVIALADHHCLRMCILDLTHLSASSDAKNSVNIFFGGSFRTFITKNTVAKYLTSFLHH